MFHKNLKSLEEFDLDTIVPEGQDGQDREGRIMASICFKRKQRDKE